MKTTTLSIVCFLLISFMLSCQESKKDETVPHIAKKGAARRGCSNSVLYKWLYPTDEYGYNGNGCQSFYIRRGYSRQFKITFSNTVAYSQNLKLRIDYQNGSLITFGVASVTGGTTSVTSPSSGDIYKDSITWTIDNATGNTAYELTLNVIGSSSSSQSENNAALILESPCTQSQNLDCDDDENIHFVLVN